MSPYKLSVKTNITNDEDQQQQQQQQHPHHSISNNINSNSSIRKAMSSADMSSPKWLQNNDFPLKRVHSSDKLQQMNGDVVIDKKDGSGGAAFDDIWSSILSQKNPGSGDPVPAPYVHPLVKRASSLSVKSLEICTESLGSETGSDGFSYPASDHGDEQHEVDEVNGAEEEVKNDFVVEVVKVNYPIINTKKVSGGGNNNVGVVRSFPPPLPSLADRDDGSNLQIRTRREDGKVVVEAVAVPSKNCFRARREDGRLLLTLTNDIDDDDDDEGLFDDDDGCDDGDGAVENENDIVGGNNVDKKLAFVMKENSCFPTTRVINVQTAYPAMIMTKLMELTSNKNVSTWPRGFNRTVTISLEKGDEDASVGKQTEVRGGKGGSARLHSLPPRPASRVSTTTASAADVLNAYEYYWRRSNRPSAAAVAVLKPLAGKQNRAVSPQVVKDTNRINKLLFGHNLKGAITKNEVVLVKAAAVGGEYLVPILRGCKEPRRSLFFLEPFCIATS